MIGIVVGDYRDDYYRLHSELVSSLIDLVKISPVCEVLIGSVESPFYRYDTKAMFLPVQMATWDIEDVFITVAHEYGHHRCGTNERRAWAFALKHLKRIGLLKKEWYYNIRRHMLWALGSYDLAQEQGGMVCQICTRRSGVIKPRAAIGEQCCFCGATLKKVRYL